MDTLLGMIANYALALFGIVTLAAAGATYLAARRLARGVWTEAALAWRMAAETLARAAAMGISSQKDLRDWDFAKSRRALCEEMSLGKETTREVGPGGTAGTAATGRGRGLRLRAGRSAGPAPRRAR